jgi:predicted transcriptional regulator
MAVSRAYDEYDCNWINDIWLTLMAVLNLIIENHGGNNYKLPQMGKRALQQLAELPVSLPVMPVALDYLDEHK